MQVANVIKTWRSSQSRGAKPQCIQQQLALHETLDSKSIQPSDPSDFAANKHPHGACLSEHKQYI